MRGRSVRIKFHGAAQLSDRLLLLAGEQKQLSECAMLPRVAGILRDRQLQFRDRRRVFVLGHVSSRQRIMPAMRGGIGLKKLVVFGDRDRKSTRLNSSHQIISYAVFFLKKKKDESLEN